MKVQLGLLLALGAGASVFACGSSDDSNGGTPTTTTDGGSPTADGATTMTDAEYSAAIATNMASSLASDLTTLYTSAQAIQAAAPSKAWDLTADAKAITDMQTAWVTARTAYEHVEGATAPIYPDIDISIDGRVEDFGPGGTSITKLTATSDMFGDQGMTGLHAVERILYISSTPAAVVTYENALGYVPAQAYPTTDAQALEFKNALCAKMVTDAKTLVDGWTAAKIQVNEAYGGLVDLMNEQKEKVTKAGLHQEESRYSQHTLKDLRDNLEGTEKIYALFQPWLQSKTGGTAIDTNVEAGFMTLDTLYVATSMESDGGTNDAFPSPPSDWSDVSPSQSDLQTPFGKLYSAVDSAVDANTPTSVAAQMADAATLLNIKD